MNPKFKSSLAADTNLEGTIVAICDWRGHVVWISNENQWTQPGDFAWAHIVEDEMEAAKLAFARVVSLSESARYEWSNQHGEYYRSWLWPLHSPDSAVCVLSTKIPSELKLLTEREREILGGLAEGMATKSIAARFDLSISTVHSHLRRSREKLGVPHAEALTVFAARYCHPNAAPQ